MVVSTKSATVIGLNVYEINIEVDTINSIPQVSIIGLPDTAISEAKERLRIAIKNSGYSFPQTKVVINLAPADLKKEGEEYDALIKSLGGIDIQLLGIGLDGHIGFNEPDEFFTKETHVVDLDPSTIEANARFFASKDEVPKTAITMGMGSIMSAKRFF